MRLLDVARNPRISMLMDLLSSVWRSADQQEALEVLLGELHPGRPRAYAEVSTVGQEAGGYVVRRLRDDTGANLLEGRSDETRGLVGRGGFLEQILRNPLPKIAHDLQLTGDPVLPPEMAAYASAMAVPIFTEEAARDWVVLFDRMKEGLNVDDLEDLIVRTSLVRAVAENLRTARQLFDANLKIQQEIAEIATIQRALLPSELPKIPGLSVAASYNAAGQAGGDIYSFGPVGQAGVPEIAGEERWAMLIGDVAGHGAAAAVVMAMLHSIFHAYPSRPAGPADLFRHANRHLCDKHIGQVFATAFLGFYDPRTRKLTYSRAGHNPPLLATAGPPPRQSYLEAVGDLPLGITPDAQYSETTLQLEPGQVLVLYTDGITEAKDPKGEFFDTRGLEAAVAAAEGDAQSVIRSVESALHKHTGSFYASDDQTLVVAQVL